MRKKNIQRLTNTDKILATETAKDPKKVNIFHSGMLVITDYLLFSKNAGVKIGLPLHVREPRFLLVTSGEAEVEVNGMFFHLCTNSVMLVPADGIVEALSKSTDFNGCAMVFPGQTFGKTYNEMFFRPQHLDHVSAADAELLKTYLQSFHALLSRSCRDAELKEAAVSMAFAVMKFLFLLYRDSMAGIRIARSQDLFNRFVDLVNRNVRKERNVAYYAGRLGISVNYLCILSKQYNHRSAKEWIEMAVIREAKILLDETNDTQAEIAAVLGFCSATQFGSFFRKHTGMTPRAYREEGTREE